MSLCFCRLHDDSRRQTPLSVPAQSLTATIVSVSVSLCLLLPLSAAGLLLLLLLLFVLWMEAVDVSSYVLQEARGECPDAEVSVHYGLSFMAAAAGVPLEVLSGLLFLLAGRTLRAGR